MARYEITAEINLKKIIAESREVAQAMNEFADDLEQIEKKYAEQQENEDKSCSNCKYWLLDKNDKNRRCKFCFEMNGRRRMTKNEVLKNFKEYLDFPLISSLRESIESAVDFLETESKPIIEIDGHYYAPENPKLKTVHGKTGEVVIGGFKEVFIDNLPPDNTERVEDHLNFMNCNNCKHHDKSFHDDVCANCADETGIIEYINWEAKDE